MTPEPAAVQLRDELETVLVEWSSGACEHKSLYSLLVERMSKLMATYAAAQRQEWEAAWAAAELPRLVASEAHVALANQVNTLTAQLAAAEGERDGIKDALTENQQEFARHMVEWNDMKGERDLLKGQLDNDDLSLYRAYEDLKAQLTASEAAREQMIVQMAGVSTAALGWISDPAKEGDYGWSVPYQDTLLLRQKYERANAAWAEVGRLKSDLAACEAAREQARKEIERLETKVTIYRNSEAALLRRREELMKALALAKSMVLSGEKMTPEAAAMIQAALLSTLTPGAAAPNAR